MDAVIRSIHTKVPGRARFKILGLRGSLSMKALLEERLGDDPVIRAFSANTVTGNLLVFFDIAISHKDLRGRLTSALSGTPAGEDTPPTRPRMAVRKRLPALPDRISEPLSRLKDAVHRILSPEAPPTEPWHTLTGEEVLRRLNITRDAGLTQEEAFERRKRYGPNVLPEPKSRSRWDIFSAQFLSLPVALLGIAAGISLITGGFLDAVVILGVVAANGAIGYVTESEAERTILSLKNAVRPMAMAMRSGLAIVVPAEDVVVGDIILLKPGSYVPADARLMEAENLSVDESVLTGESMPVFKTSRTLKSLHLPLADRTNMVYMGTLATGGEGLALVVSTGQFTEMGKLQVLLSETTSPQTPIERQLENIGDQLVVVCLGICGVVFFMGFLRGYGFIQMLRVAVSLAAAAVPEGLPAAATINFALGIQRMKKHHVLIRHLQAVETLGAVQTVCLDKTGTITWNRMTMARVFVGFDRIDLYDGRFFLNDEPVAPVVHHGLGQLVRVCCLCSEATLHDDGKGERPVLSGTSTEKALLQMGLEAGVDIHAFRRENPRLKLWNRSEKHLYMASLHARQDGKGLFYAVKGNPVDVLSMCSTLLEGCERKPLTEELRLQIETENERMASEALRVLGVACAEPHEAPNHRLEEDLTWLGLAGMEDPIRDGAADLIEMYHRAGIGTVMITGDQSPTAYAVAEELGIRRKDRPVIMDSTELIAIDPQIMSALAREVDVYSRVSPAHKLRIVQALQAAGRVVAMTGDGINDGPALKAADIGIAMGESGTDVAREVADVVLEKDNLETLIIAVREGRTTYSNIRKSVHFFLSTNLSEIMIMFASMGLGIGFPLNVMQLLWINLISDILPGLALSMEAPEGDVLALKPRDSRAPLLSGSDYRRMTSESGVITAGALGIYLFGIARYGMGPQARTLAFQGLALGQLLHAFSCRSEHHSLFDREGPAPNRVFDVSIGGSILVQIATMVLPGLRRFLGLTPLSLMDAVLIGGCSLLPLAVNEATKPRKEPTA